MPKESNLELKVGGIVIFGLICFSVFIYSVGDFEFLSEGKEMRIVFNLANGVKKAAPVRIAGVDGGAVREVKLFFDSSDGRTKAEVTIWLQREVEIPIDSTVVINQLGLLGEKYIEILPGINTQYYYKDGDTIIGKDPILNEAISKKVLDVANKIEKTIDGINQIIRDEETQHSFKDTIIQLDSITGNLDEIMNHIRTGEGTIGRLFYDNRLYDDLQGLTSDLRANPWKILYRPTQKKKK